MRIDDNGNLAQSIRDMQARIDCLEAENRELKLSLGIIEMHSDVLEMLTPTQAAIVAKMPDTSCAIISKMWPEEGKTQYTENRFYSHICHLNKRLLGTGYKIAKRGGETIRLCARTHIRSITLLRRPANRNS